MFSSGKLIITPHGVGFFIMLMTLLALAACSRSDTTAGVENLWREDGFAVQEGVTTEAELLEALGPPSQLINLGRETVYYYLTEAFRSDRLLLIVYNRTQRNTNYDRAIFFFDENGVLTKAALSDNALPRE
ncbi:MAG: hypothetical protein AAF698_04305 [Pseudomonadota bacterium]